MSTLRVSLVQQPLVWHDPQGNRAYFEALLLPLAGHTDLVVLPETFTTGFSMDVERLGESAGGPSSQWLTRLATRLEAAVTGSDRVRTGRIVLVGAAIDKNTHMASVTAKLDEPSAGLAPAMPGNITMFPLPFRYSHSHCASMRPTAVSEAVTNVM